MNFSINVVACYNAFEIISSINLVAPTSQNDEEMNGNEDKWNQESTQAQSKIP